MLRVWSGFPRACLSGYRYALTCVYLFLHRSMVQRPPHAARRGILCKCENQKSHFCLFRQLKMRIKRHIIILSRWKIQGGK
nr:MAG TPA: hypothetical protein [Bacteriophage sp.]